MIKQPFRSDQNESIHRNVQEYALNVLIESGLLEVVQLYTDISLFIYRI